MCSCCSVAFEWPRSFAQFQRTINRIILGCRSEKSADPAPCSICSMEVPTILGKSGILVCSSCAREHGLGSKIGADNASPVYLPVNFKIESRSQRLFRANLVDVWWIRFWAICLSVGVSMLPVIAAVIFIYFK